jgi:hypothetical protein
VELALVEEVTALDVPFLPPLLSVALDGRLHVFGRRGGGDSCHLTLDSKGRKPETLPAVPLERVTSAARLASGVLLAGPDAATRLPVVLELGRDGSEKGRWSVPQPAPLAFWPQLAVGDARAWLAWATGGEEVTVWVARLEPGDIRPAAAGGFEAPLTDLVVLAGEPPLLAAGHGTRRVDVVAGAPGHTSRMELNASEAFAVSAARAGGTLAVAWISRVDQALDVQTFDAGLKPSGRSRVDLGGGGRLRAARLLGSGDRLALSWQTAAATGSLASDPEADGPESVEVRHWIAGFSLHGAGLGEAFELRPPGVAYDTAAWLDERLLVIHGSEQPFVSVYEARPRA